MPDETPQLSPEHEAALIRKLELEAKGFELANERMELSLGQYKRELADDQASSGYHRLYDFTTPVNSTSVQHAMITLGHWSRREPGAPIQITFKSPGGSVIDGLAFYDFLEDLKARGHYIKTLALGWAASMGGILLQAGHTRLIGRNSFVLIHEVSAGAGGKMSELEDEVAFIKRLQEKCIDILAERSTLSKRQIKAKWARRDWWLDADDAVRLGFADAIR